MEDYRILFSDLRSVSQMNADLAPAAQFMSFSCRFRILLETMLDFPTVKAGMSKNESFRNWNRVRNYLFFFEF